ncbi:hypothetical protein JXQ31_17020 [candidate division KSB1 bacterium]|nr:hypothetical protein [candidate division KSB1 bacterium]
MVRKNEIQKIINHKNISVEDAFSLIIKDQLGINNSTHLSENELSILSNKINSSSKPEKWRSSIMTIVYFKQQMTIEYQSLEILFSNFSLIMIDLLNLNIKFKIKLTPEIVNIYANSYLNTLNEYNLILSSCGSCKSFEHSLIRLDKKLKEILKKFYRYFFIFQALEKLFNFPLYELEELEPEIQDYLFSYNSLINLYNKHPMNINNEDIPALSLEKIKPSKKIINKIKNEINMIDMYLGIDRAIKIKW